MPVPQTRFGPASARIVSWVSSKAFLIKGFWNLALQAFRMAFWASGSHSCSFTSTESPIALHCAAVLAFWILRTLSRFSANLALCIWKYLSTVSNVLSSIEKPPSTSWKFDNGELAVKKQVMPFLVWVLLGVGGMRSFGSSDRLFAPNSLLPIITLSYFMTAFTPLPLAALAMG